MGQMSSFEKDHEFFILIDSKGLLVLVVYWQTTKIVLYQIKDK
jgi:hypothetical protein